MKPMSLKRRVLTVLIAALMLALCLPGLTACINKNKPVAAISVADDEFTFEINTSDEDVKSALKKKLKVKVDYEDGSAETLSYPNEGLTVGNIKTSEPGRSVVFVAFGGKYTNIFVTITGGEQLEPDEVKVVGYQTPSFVTKYDSNIGLHANPELDFAVRDNGYTVGTDNPFVFMPTVDAVSEDGGSAVTLKKYRSSVKVEEKNGAIYTELTGEALAGAVEFINYEDGKFEGQFRFKPAAVGKTYRITQKPGEGLVLESLLNATATLEVKVAEGLNVHDLEGLSRLDNIKKSHWFDWKIERNIPFDYSGKGIFLHSDIALTKSALPAGFFGTDGLLKTWQAIFAHATPVGEDFTFNGNYFNIDASAMPLENRGSNSEGRSEIFCFAGVGNTIGEEGLFPNLEEAMGTPTVKNFSAVGNNGKSNLEKYIDGISLLRAGPIVLDNVIARKFLTTVSATRSMRAGDTEYIATKAEETFVFNNCRFYDAFSTHLFVWTATVEINNSIFKSCGGPVMVISDYVFPLYPSVTYDTATVLETAVNATDAWFNLYGMSTLVTEMLKMEEHLEGYKMTLDGYMTKVVNPIAAIKHENGIGDRPQLTRGFVKRGNDYLLNMNTDIPNPVLDGVKGAMTGALNPFAASPIFMGHGNMSVSIVTEGAMGLPYFLNPLTFSMDPFNAEPPVWHNIFGAGSAGTDGYLRIYAPEGFVPQAGGIDYMAILGTARYIG